MIHYRPEIDGLRALAVIPVVLFHADVVGFDGGFVGVDVFFVISGYLITSILLRQIGKGQFSFAAFYERRARRLLPALAVVMAASVPAAIVISLPEQLEDFGQSLIAVVFFGSNILFWRESGYFASTAEVKPLLHTWSLAIEEQFYLVFPILLIAVHKVGLRSLRWLLAATIALSFLCADWLSYRWPSAAFFLIPTAAWELGVGAVIGALAHQRGGNLDWRLPNATRDVIALVGVAAVVSAVVSFDSAVPFPGRFALLPTVGAGMIIAFATEGTWVARGLSTRPLVGVGLISYSLYLWHQPMLALARQLTSNEPPAWLLALLVMISFPLAYASWRLVEAPFRDRERVSQRLVWSFAGVSAGVFVTIGVVLWLSSGLVGRYDEKYHGLVRPQTRGTYVGAFSRTLRLKPFQDEGRPNIFVVGDSYGEDFLNALAEGGLTKDVELSFWKIPARCGNLLVDDDLSAHISPRHRAGCRENGRYERPAVQAQLREADLVILASEWKPWVVDYLPTSMENLRKTYGAEVWVVGTKSFGAVDTRALLAQAEAGTLQQTVGSPLAERVATNEKMRELLSEDAFIDLFAELCGPDYRCPMVDAGGRLLTFDGGHLTREGAALLGEHLGRHPLVSTLPRRRKVTVE